MGNSSSSSDKVELDKLTLLSLMKSFVEQSCRIDPEARVSLCSFVSEFYNFVIEQKGSFVQMERTRFVKCVNSLLKQVAPNIRVIGPLYNDHYYGTQDYSFLTFKGVALLP
jgi:hypothetical protein